MNYGRNSWRNYYNSPIKLKANSEEISGGTTRRNSRRKGNARKFFEEILGKKYEGTGAGTF